MVGHKESMRDSSPMEQTAKHIIFVGHVQGVGFRYTADGIARQYSVTGFVKNLSDGTVEMLVQGPAQELDNFLGDVRDAFTGHIRETRIEQVPFDPRYKDFRITF